MGVDELPQWKRVLLRLYAACWIASGMPLFLRALGILFLPSREWVAAHSATANTAGFLLTLGWLTSCYWAPKFRQMAPSLKKLFTFVLGTCMTWTMGTEAIYIGVPMLRAAQRQKTELEFVVKQASGFSDHKCRRRIELRDMPFMFDEICGVDPKFRNSLHPGERLVVTGTGSAWGIFPSMVRRADCQDLFMSVSQGELPPGWVQMRPARGRAGTCPGRNRPGRGTNDKACNPCKE